MPSLTDYLENQIAFDHVAQTTDYAVNGSVGVNAQSNKHGTVNSRTSEVLEIVVCAKTISAPAQVGQQ